MKRRPDARRSGLLILVVVSLITVLLAVLLGWLRATAPLADTAGVAVPAAIPAAQDLPSCPAMEAGGARPRDGTPVTSGIVLDCPRVLDGLVVTYAGEVVGDVLARDGGSWVLVNDDAYALTTGPLGASGTPAGTNSGLTVWLPDPLDDLAATPGRRDQRGDVLRVTATVVREDPADGGGLTLRARDAELLSPAVVLDTPIHTRQAAVALVLGVLAVLAVARERWSR